MYFVTLEECVDELGEVNEILDSIDSEIVSQKECKNIFFAVNDNWEKVGFVYLKINLEESNLNILNFSVFNKFKNRGHEEEMLRFIDNFSRFNGCDEIITVVEQGKKNLLNYIFLKIILR